VTTEQAVRQPIAGSGPLLMESAPIRPA
jgi:hypothetical protein